MNSTKLLEQNINATIDSLKDLFENELFKQQFASATAAVIEAYKKGGRLYIAGNGGSAADAQHLAAEFVSKLSRDRNPLPAEALTTDSSILTAIGNDYGYEYVFSRQLDCKLRQNDIFLGITTSGKSINILKALEICKSKGNKSIILTGRDGGEAKKLTDYCLVAPGIRTSTIQEIHILLAHTLCESLELEMFPI